MVEPRRKWWHLKLNGLRAVTLFAPPVALGLLWLSPLITRREKILGSVGIPVFCILYVSLAAWLLDVCFGVVLYEWRGGYHPTLTLSPTLPDYDAVEASRAQQRRRPVPVKLNSGDSAPWPAFRGFQRDGHYTAQAILTNWPATGLRCQWRQPVGGGYASFTVAGGLAYTIEQRRSKEVVAAYEIETGHEVWAHGWEAEFRESIGGDGPRATPTYAEGRLYALGGRGELRCLAAKTGELIWRHDTIRENSAQELKYGASASPLVVDDKVIVLAGGTNGHAVIAYHRLSGELVWHALDDEPAYASPMLVNLADHQQLLLVFTRRTVGLEPASGKLLWEFKWGEPLMGRNVAQPVLLAGNRFLLSAGYDTGCTTVEVQKSATNFAARQVWSNKFLKNKFASSVFWQGHIYGRDEEILTCLDAATGERKWKDGRYGYGQLLLAGGHLVILCGNGDLALVKAVPTQHEELARVPGIKGKTWNCPAIADGHLLIRNAVEMACYDLSTK